jgi:hypothetical protein
MLAEFGLAATVATEELPRALAACYGSSMIRAPRVCRLAAGAVCLATLSLAACSSLSVERTSETSGTFRATGLALTLVSIDLPKGAQLIARENASDANLPNMQVHETTVFPYLGPIDWLLDIISVRWAEVEGTWGYPPGT